MRPRVLLTGFEPFRNYAVNSSWEGVRLVAARRADVRAALLPVDHGRAAGAIRVLIAEERPRAVLLVGLAAGSSFRLETSPCRRATVASRSLAVPPTHAVAREPAWSR